MFGDFVVVLVLAVCAVARKRSRAGLAWGLHREGNFCAEFALPQKGVKNRTKLYPGSTGKSVL